MQIDIDASQSLKQSVLEVWHSCTSSPLTGTARLSLDGGVMQDTRLRVNLRSSDGVSGGNKQRDRRRSAPVACLTECGGLCEGLQERGTSQIEQGSCKAREDCCDDRMKVVLMNASLVL